MPRARPSRILFLCTGNYYRSRYAECLFNAAAARMGLPWQASSRALALERGSNNVGPMASAAVQALTAQGIHREECGRLPVQATPTDFEQADWIVAVQEAEHRPLLEERFPAWTERVEFWHVADAAEALAIIEREVMDLVARLLRGGVKRPAGPLPPLPEKAPAADKPRPRSIVRVGRETKGRRGKGVTTISDLPLDEAGLRELAAQLKQRCGTGGTIKDGRIEMQGDLRDRLIAELQALGYAVKRVGG